MSRREEILNKIVDVVINESVCDDFSREKLDEIGELRDVGNGELSWKFYDVCEVDDWYLEEVYDLIDGVCDEYLEVIEDS